ncbi:MAG: NADPH-dependent F420 reductase [Steroidobacteraceae bacterium]|nr:NADPH-dependent F420 reductase [Steroidobacteraceae bacterium]
MTVRHLPRLRRRDVLKAAGAAAALGALPLAGRAAAADAPRLKIGLIGSGRVGSALGRVWAHAGHEVMFSSRHLDDDEALAAEIGANARAGTPQQAATFGEVLVFTVPYGALPALGRSLADSIRGKIVIDTCNPFPNRDGEIADRALAQGAGLVSAELLPGARIVRAFNAVNARRMAVAHEEPGRIGMPIAGDDEEAIRVASALIREIGYEPVLIGGAAMGKYLMPGTPLAGERTAAEIRQIAATLQ